VIIISISHNGPAPGAVLVALALVLHQTKQFGNECRDNSYLSSFDAFANAATLYHGDSQGREIVWHTEDVKQLLVAIEILALGALPQKVLGFPRLVIVRTSLFL
jgi:hypothetical protein